MQVGEIVVARMKRGAGIGRCLALTNQAGRVRISVGRNRTAELPAERILLTTGITASGEEEVEEFRRSCEALASDIDLKEAWEVAHVEASPIDLDDLAELYWGHSRGAAQRVGLRLHLDRTSLYFVEDQDGYVARPREQVQEIQARREREAENVQAEASLMESLSDGSLPPRMTRYQSGLLEHLRGYATHGEDYTRAATARSLLERIEPTTRDHQRLSFELLVGVGIFSPDEPLELKRAEISEEFPGEAVAEASAIDLSRALEEPQRRDLTDIPTVTIDDAWTEERDDALSLETEVPEPPPGSGPDQPAAVYLVGIHIADAGTLILPGSALDQEADRRMATLYLPERKVTMLPPEISTGPGSLVPGEKRVALSLLARTNGSGDLLEWEVVPSVIRSQASLTYEEADRAMGDAEHPWGHMLALLNRIADSLRQKREEAGAITLEPPEMLIEVNASGDVDVRMLPRSVPARRMVAEFMILCNSLLAEFCRRREVPAAYRSQSAADLSDLVADSTGGTLHRYQVMRRLPPADLDIIPAAHAALGVPAYIQATSPLRRYPDLVMQRQISHFLSSGRPRHSSGDIASLAQRAEVQLRELGRLENYRRHYWILKYLNQSLPTEEGDGAAALFNAVVLENWPGRTALLELVDYPFRFRAKLPERCAQGETVTLRLRGVDLWRRTAHFVHEPSSLSTP